MRTFLISCALTLAMSAAAYGEISQAFKLWLYDGDSSIYEEIYIDDDTTIVVTVIDCDKTLHFLLGGKLNANEAAKHNMYEYTYIYTPTARMADWIRKNVLKELSNTQYLTRDVPGCVE